ncbi:MAG: redoxin domain-containing protein [Myxococcales bacterium]|nr:redoxin domain-containing protein [Myxococcales bacterium]
MMRWSLIGVAMIASGCASSSATTTSSAATIGQAAPAFTLTDLSGTSHSLSDLRGSTVVLEWFNPGCPYVKYAHGEGPLEDQASRVQGDGIKWLAINSGAPGKQGHGVEANTAAKAAWSMEHPVLVDEDGAVGRAYGAITTPQMYVIDPEGTLVYKGAIDNKPMGKGRGTTKNFVDLALASLAAGTAVETADTKPYGCSVKYAN